MWRALLMRFQLHAIGVVFVFTPSRILTDLLKTPAWLTTVRPSKAVFMQHRRTAVNWRSRPLRQEHKLIGDENLGRHGMAIIIMNDEHLAYLEEGRSLLHVYTAATMQLIYTPTRNVNVNLTLCIVFCPDAHAVITGHYDGVVHVHTLPQSTSQHGSIGVQLVGVPSMQFSHLY
jgi:hypothetical protein